VLEAALGLFIKISCKSDLNNPFTVLYSVFRAILLNSVLGPDLSGPKDDFIVKVAE